MIDVNCIYFKTTNSSHQMADVACKKTVVVHVEVALVCAGLAGG